MLKNCASKRKICENEKHTHYTLFWTVWFVWFWFFIGCRAERTSFCFVSSFRSPWLDHPNDYETFFEKFLILTCYSFKQLCLELFCGDAWHFNSTFRFLRLSDQIIILNYDLKKTSTEIYKLTNQPTTFTIYSVWRILSEVRALQYIQTSFKEKSTKLIKPPTQQNSCPQTREWNQNWQFIIFFFHYAI